MTFRGAVSARQIHGAIRGIREGGGWEIGQVEQVPGGDGLRSAGSMKNGCFSWGFHEDLLVFHGGFHEDLLVFNG